MRDVIGIGALNLDILYEVEDLNALREGGLPLCLGRETSLPPLQFRKLMRTLEQVGTLKFKSGGGSAANTLVALARMGFKTGFVGRAGADQHGAFILREMEGVDISQVKRQGENGICLAVLDRHRDRALLVQPYVNDSVCFEDLDLTYLSSTGYLHMSAFVADGPLRAQKQLMKVLPSHVQVSLDPGEFYAGRGLEEVLPLIRRASILFATDHEICALTGKDDYRVGCRQIISLGPEVVVCKMGKKGAYLFFKDGGAEFHPQEQAEVVDNTGAGDVYDAGFLTGLLLGRPLDDCLAFAHRVAAKSIGGYGRQKYPDAEDLKAMQGG